jgi:hypothetical protein
MPLATQTVLPIYVEILVFFPARSASGSSRANNLPKPSRVKFCQPGRSTFPPAHVPNGQIMAILLPLPLNDKRGAVVG